MKGIRVYTAEAVWRAQLEESLKLLKELEGTKADLGKKLEEVGRGAAVSPKDSTTVGVAVASCGSFIDLPPLLTPPC